MLLYHGTTIDFEDIDLEKSLTGKDFGCGFYLSDSYEQAYELASFKAALQEASPVVLTYSIEEAVFQDGSLRSLRFPEYSREWAQFILMNRQNKDKRNAHEFDLNP